MLGKSRKVFRTVGGMGYTGLDHLLFHVTFMEFGRLHFSGSLTAVISCKAEGHEGGLKECYLTVNEGENAYLFPAPHISQDSLSIYGPCWVNNHKTA